MFLSLLIVTFLIALSVCFIIARLFSRPIDGIIGRIVDDDIAAGWAKYVKFAIYVVGISGGVKMHYLERFIRQQSDDFIPPVLTADRWVLEIYRTVIESLQAIAWALLVFFLFALIAYVIVRVFELFVQHRSQDKTQDDSG